MIGPDESAVSNSFAPCRDVLTDEAAGKQVNMLLYCLGEEAEAVLTLTNASSDEREAYDRIFKSAEECHFRARTIQQKESTEWGKRRKLHRSPLRISSTLQVATTEI